MRIGCVQFAPKLGDVDNNLNRADAVLSRGKTEDLDLIVLPELAFSGYNFKSAQDIEPFLEHSGSGITSLWARTIALKYNCVVTVGYPEKVDASGHSGGPKYYNSALVINGDGETIANYRKSFLYHTDETWAREGEDGFFNGFIPGLGKLSIGICMDINPYKFQAPWHAFEFAFHILNVHSNLAVVSMAWMTSDDPRRYSRMPNEPDMEALTYWVTRLEPLIRSDNQDEIIIVFCNRVGHEDDATYSGTSAVIGIQDGEVKIYGLLGRGEKELLVIDTKNPPYGKLVYRPDSSEGQVETSDHGTLSPSTDDDKNDDKSDTKGDVKGKGLDVEKPAADKDAQTPTASTEKAVDAKSPIASASLVPIASTTPLPMSPEKANPITLPKKSVPKPITVPENSEETDGGVIPTPSMPSPTPQAIRPRLIIPESPPINYQSVPNSAISNVSLSSERSFNSVLSNESLTSVSTVRSNPRPPEESTPYPDTPFSGYPSNVFTERRAYNGHIGIAPYHDDPTTAIEGMSPLSAASTRRFWLQPDSTLHTPSTVFSGLTPIGRPAEWSPGTPIGRRAEPFPWPAITNHARTPSTQTAATAPEALRASSQSPESNASSNRTYNTSKTSRSDSSKASKGTAQHHSDREPVEQPPRPPSPKSRNVSRNASRTGMHQRSASALRESDVSDAILQYLDSMGAPRPGSASHVRSSSTSGTPRPERRAKSRHHSKNRPSKVDTSSRQRETIPIAVSPSILSDEGRSPMRSLSDGSLHLRSSSVSSPQLHEQRDSRSTTPNLGRNTPQPRAHSRATSRGRARAPKAAPTNGVLAEPGILEFLEHERSSSADSTRTDRLHTRVRRRGETKQQSRARTPIRAFSDEETYAYRNASMLDQHLSSSETRASVSTIRSSQSSLATAASYTTLSTAASTPRSVMSQTFATTGSPKPAPPKAERYDYGVIDPRQRATTPKPPPPKAAFNPQTPKAIIYPSDNSDVEPLPEKQLNAQETTPTATRCGDSITTKNDEAQKSQAVEASTAS